MQIKHDIVESNEGVVLVMVLIVLVATIIMGILLTRSSFFETKIAGNQRIQKQEFYTTEGASDYIISEFDSIASGLSMNQSTAYNFSTYLPTGKAISNAQVTVTLIRTGNPPIGSGTGVAHTVAYYYRIDTKRGNQNIEMGVWKAFPRQ